MIRPSRLPTLLLAAALAACDGVAADGVGGGDAAPETPGDTAGDGPSASVECDPDDGGLTLPEGFCALVAAEDLGRVRHLAVAPNGDLYAAVRGDGGGVLALRDADGDGRFETRERFGPEEGGTGIAVHDGWLWFAPDDRVIRWRMPSGGALVPSGQPETVVRGLPTGGHGAKSLAFDGSGGLFVNVGSRSNACQRADRQAGSPGIDPCTELETRAGIWRFDANATGQTQADGERWATGIRNGLALAWHDGVLWSVPHGRDQLHGNWPDLFTVEENAEKPAEELLRLPRGADAGWPYCYHDPQTDEKVLAPEYGGDGTEVGRCADKLDPLLAFPAHWAPNDMLFYDGEQFPEGYRGGLFVAFHGSWNRAPLPQQGYKVVFVPFAGGAPTGEFTDFADGFTGSDTSPRGATHRPTGLAQAPDGSLYVSDDAGGTLWRILHRGR